MLIALDATYSIGRSLSGVGVYSRNILHGLANAHPEDRFRFCYRPHRFGASFGESLPRNVRRFPLVDRYWLPSRAAVFHGLNQRLPVGTLPRSVTTFHDLFVMTGDYSTPEFRERFTEQARDAASRSQMIVTVSAFTADQVCSLLGVERSRIRVIHHGVDIPDAEPALVREPVILHVGAIQKRKNIGRLIRAFAQTPAEWRLVLAGSVGYGGEEILSAIQGPLRQRVTITGYIANEELERWYRRASILAFPSMDEGFGMPVLEAMARGLPVVTSNRSALPEVAGDAAVLVDPGVVDAIAAGLKTLIHSPSAMAEYAARGRRRAQEFTWETAVRKTWDVYREMSGAL